ncbi:hypothetical protein A7X67_00880 [Clostridium sp. W14A]|nr:hypothetical protein A7X67_00880 [Clostridium sp. W14A]
MDSINFVCFAQHNSYAEFLALLDKKARRQRGGLYQIRRESQIYDLSIKSRQVCSASFPGSQGTSGVVPTSSLLPPSGFSPKLAENRRQISEFGRTKISGSIPIPSPPVGSPTIVAKPVCLQKWAKPSAEEFLPLLKQIFCR